MSLAARRLTETHRLAQARLGANTVALMVPLFPLLDATDLQGSFPQWLRGVVPMVQAQRAKSSALAAAYLRAHRLLVLGPNVDPFSPVLAGEAPIEGLTTSMVVTGPAAFRGRLGRGLDQRVAADMTLAGAAGAAMRWSLNAGRETITETIKADRRMVGYERVTSGAACEFCSMLADRGAVYSEDTADFEAHDHCSCSAEPVYR